MSCVSCANGRKGRSDPDFAQLFAPLGIACGRRVAVDSPHFALLGVKTAAAAGECRIAHVFDTTPAQRAGLSGGDMLVAFDGLRVTPPVSTSCWRATCRATRCA